MIKRNEDKYPIQEIKENKLSIWMIAIFIILGVILFSVFFDEDEDYTEYASCVNNCVFDINDCVFIDVAYDNQGNAWVKWEDYDICSLDLETCVSDCKSNYID